MKYKMLFVCITGIIFTSCKKSGSSTVAQPDAYMTTSAASTWNYQRTNSGVVTNYTITSTARDTTINGRSYHIFSNSTGGNQYYSISGHDYYQFDSLPAPLTAGAIERLYLKDDAAVAVSWLQSISVNVPGIPLPIPLTITNSVAEKGISRNVNSINYSDVIHISTTISSSLIPAAGLVTNIHSYYARKYGLIENSTSIQVNYAGFVQNVSIQTKLMSATLY